MAQPQNQTRFQDNDMIKKVVLLLLFCFGVWLVVTTLTQSGPRGPVYNINDGTVFTVPLLNSPLQKQSHPVIDNLNAINARIKAVQADRLDIKQNQHRFARLNGTFAFEKPNNFRMTVQSQVGGELDLGSNDSLFWFWSRRYQNGTLFFCKHTEFEKARMKRPFNPKRMMQSFGYNEIDLTGCQIGQHDKYIAVIRLEEKGMKSVRLVDPARPAIIGSYLYDANNHVVASTEAIKFDPSGRYPVRWVMMWNEEGLSMELELLNPRFNTPINPAQWRLPNAPKSVDMATD